MLPWEEKRERVPFGFELICSESCGCQNIPRRNVIRDLYFQQTRFLKTFYTQQDQMAEDLFEAGDLQDLMRIISRNHSGKHGRSSETWLTFLTRKRPGTIWWRS